MFCRECGKMIQEGGKFCTGCGTKVESITMSNNVIERKDEVNTVQEISENVQIPTENVSNVHASNPVASNDKTSVGLNILGFFVPLAGLILFIIMKKETPKKAKSIGISALVGYILAIILSVVVCIYIYGFAIPNMKNELYQQQYNRNYHYYMDRNYNI